MIQRQAQNLLKLSCRSTVTTILVGTVFHLIHPIRCNYCLLDCDQYQNIGCGNTDVSLIDSYSKTSIDLTYASFHPYWLRASNPVARQMPPHTNSIKMKLNSGYDYTMNIVIKLQMDRWMDMHQLLVWLFRYWLISDNRPAYKCKHHPRKN